MSEQGQMSEGERLKEEQIRSLVEKQVAEAEKLRAERVKLKAETWYYPLIAVATVVIAATALLKVFF